MPPAARISDNIEHGLGMLGIVAGAIAGALLIAGTCATGGLLGAAVVGAAATVAATAGAVGVVASAALIGETIFQGLGQMFGIGITTGAIAVQASPNVRIGGMPAARAKLDGGPCSGMIFNHFPQPLSLIAQGSSNVFINGQPAARVGDKMQCDGDIKHGEPTVIIGGGTVTVLPISDWETWLHNALQIVAVVAFGIAAGAILLGAALTGLAAFATAALGLGAAFLVGAAVNWASGQVQAWGDSIWPGLGKVLGGSMQFAALAVGTRVGMGEPVDAATGEVLSTETDFVLPGKPELSFSRAYASSLQHEDWLGPNWCSSWGQRVHNTSAGLVHYFPGDGRQIVFNLNGEAGPDGWLRNPTVNKIRLRATPTGFEVRDEQRQLQRFDRAFGATWLITSIEDRHENAIRFHYDETGALRSVEHPGYRLRVTCTAQRMTAIELENPGGSLSTLVRFQYDAAGCLSGVDNGSGAFFRYEYDSAARLIRWTDRLHTWYQYEYDHQGRCIASVGPDGMYHYQYRYNTAARTATAIDSYGVARVYRHDEHNRVVAQHDGNGAVRTTQYDDRGNKLSETDAEMRSWSYKYDSDGDLLEVTNPAGQTTKIERNSDGQPIVLTDPAGKRWLRRYDNVGNLIEAGPEAATPWRYEYDNAGNLLRIIDPEGNTRRYTYNAAGLLISATDGEGHITRYQRDALGRVSTQTDAVGSQTHVAYNSMQKLGRVVLPDAGELSWLYDPEGNITQRVGADGSAYQYNYGLFDKLLSIQRPSGATLRFSYDLEARLTAVTNERGETWEYGYDPAGRLIREKEFSGRTQHFKYDAAGYLIERLNGNGEKTTIERDKAGRMVAKRSADGAAAEFTYDANGFISVAKNESITVKFERDEYGRVLREMQGERIVESFYNARGLRTKRNIDGQETNWRYDANGRMRGIGLPGDEWLEFTRDAVGRDTERHLTAGKAGGGFVLRQQFDPMSRLTRQWAGAGTAPLSERRLEYDVNGNPVTMSESLWGSSHFTYNPDERLESVGRRRGLAESFQYDEAGDIAAVWTGGFSAANDKPAMGTLQMRFVSEGGRLKKAGEAHYLYDADGRTIEKRDGDKVWQYEWSVEGQLRAVVTPKGERWTYEYDAFGRRVRKNGPSGTTTYVWDGAVVAEEITPDRSAFWHYEPGTFRPVAKVEDGAAYACVTDQIGTPRELINRNGKLAWSARFTAFGEVESAQKSATDCPIRFQGQWFDEESGLHYNWNRYYEPETGRYLTADPIGLNGGTRSYGYVHNPLGWVDPGGLASYPGVDFTGNPDLFPATGNQQNIVQITMQGSRQRDFTQAYQDSGISKADATDYTWHHVDDFNPTTGETTMQLIKTSTHVESFPHTGSVSQYEQHFGVEYDTPDAIKASYEQGWLKGRVPKELQDTVCK